MSTTRLSTELRRKFLEGIRDALAGDDSGITRAREAAIALNDPTFSRPHRHLETARSIANTLQELEALPDDEAIAEDVERRAEAIEAIDGRIAELVAERRSAARELEQVQAAGRRRKALLFNLRVATGNAFVRKLFTDRLAAHVEGLEAAMPRTTLNRETFLDPEA